MPVAAVTSGGRSSVSSGSANTAFASSAGEKITRFRCVSSSEITLERPTSEPVPAVVGRATKCGSACCTGARRRCVPRVVEHVALVHGHHGHRLGDVERGAAAEADDRVGAVGPERRRAGHHLRRRRVAEHAVEHRARRGRRRAGARNSASTGSRASARSVTTSGRASAALAQ